MPTPTKSRVTALAASKVPEPSHRLQRLHLTSCMQPPFRSFVTNQTSTQLHSLQSSERIDRYTTLEARKDAPRDDLTLVKGSHLRQVFWDDPSGVHLTRRA